MRGHEVVPDVEHILDPILEHVAGQAQGAIVVGSEEHRGRQPLEVLL